MTPVDQIRTGFGRGQCTEATFASLLDVPLADVPELWGGPSIPADAPHGDHQPMANRVAMWEWFKAEHGVMTLGVQLSRAVPTIGEAWSLAREVFPGLSGYHAACGRNPDGNPHMVVALDGELVHDPNPSRQGLVNCDCIQWLESLATVPEAARELPSAEWRVEVSP